jgi:hypothetical protein
LCRFSAINLFNHPLHRSFANIEFIRDFSNMPAFFKKTVNLFIAEVIYPALPAMGFIVQAAGERAFETIFSVLATFVSIAGVFREQIPLNLVYFFLFQFRGVNANLISQSIHRTPQTPNSQRLARVFYSVNAFLSFFSTGTSSGFQHKAD